MALLIRPLLPGDLPVLDQALRAQGRFIDHAARWQKVEAGRTVYLVAWDGPSPLGHVLLHDAVPTLQRPLEVQSQGTAWIEDLWVAPEHRGCGLAHLLMDAAESLATVRGHRLVGLDVGLENERAQALYHRRGYLRLSVPPYVIGGVNVVDGQAVEGRMHFSDQAARRCLIGKDGLPGHGEWFNTVTPRRSIPRHAWLLQTRNDVKTLASA